jgi:hypothetical protein
LPKNVQIFNAQQFQEKVDKLFEIFNNFLNTNEKMLYLKINFTGEFLF